MGKRGNNEGTITKRADGRWEARLSLPDGQRRSFYGKTRQEVSRKLAEAQRQVESGLPLVNERQMVEQFLASWLEMMRHVVKPRTWIRYRDFMRLHVVPVLGHVAIAKLTPQQVQSLYAQKLTEGLSPTTVRHLHMVLHRALDNALRLGVVIRNVTELVDPPRMKRHEMAVLTPEQARALLAAAKGDRMEALYVLALSTGMRQGELLGLRWQDVDIEHSVLSVRATLQCVDGTFIFAEPKSARSRRQIALSKRAIDALQRHQAQQLEERLALGPVWDDTYDLVFPNTIGRPVDDSHLRRREFQPLLKRAGLPRIRFHDLRHTAATLLLRQGVNPKIVSEMLGHASVSITLDLYSHVLPDMQQVAAEAMDTALGGF